ncbi:MAG: hypothetical protein NC388_02100 [Clostridium sp.]|nr:hypothetical protein [Clostridium sp.]
MLENLLITLAIIAVSMVLLSIKLLLKKNGRFPNTHVGHSAAMRRRGITCVQSMDFAERQDNPYRIPEKRMNKQNS